MLKEIMSLSWLQTLGIFWGFMGTISPGFLLLYMYKPDLVTNLETAKLVIFSLALCLPIVCANLFVAQSTFQAESEEGFKQAMLAAFMSAMVCYTALLWSYFYNLLFSQFLLVLLTVQVLVAAVAVVSNRNERKNSVSDKSTSKD